MFWTWDHSTEWALNRPGAHTIGSCNEYSRTTEAFVADYSALLQWCGRHGIDAVVVWGLLRDCHGGLDAAKRLCDVAAKERVRLLCGVGLNAYGGVYYEGDSRYNLEQHLAKHPELQSFDMGGNPLCFYIDPNGKRTPLRTSGALGPRGFYQSCPSRRENQDFMRESLAWLFKNLPLGGVQIESGDTGVCQCKQCRDRRQHLPAPFSWYSWEDMALVYPLAADAIRSAAPDAWIVCETYSNPTPDEGPGREPAFGNPKPGHGDQCLARFPRGNGVFAQWVCDRFLDDGPTGLKWTNEGRVSNVERRNVMRAHFSTYWSGYRGELAVQKIARMVQRSVLAGFDAISLFGETSPFQAGAELNYLAMADFGNGVNPNAEVESCLERVGAPLLGGIGNARDFARFARLLENRNQIPAVLPSIYSRLVALPPDAARRWCWLANHLASFTES